MPCVVTSDLYSVVGSDMPEARTGSYFPTPQVLDDGSRNREKKDQEE